MIRFARWIAASVLLTALLWGSLVLAIFLFGRRDEARPAQAIVVLGAAQYDGRPSPVLRARLDHAIELFRKDVAPLLIVTGGVGVGDTVSEADVARRYALRAGIPDSAVLLERTGVSTVQSMAAVAELMREREIRSAVLVSDPFHMLRLRLLARRLGMRAFSSPTRSSPIGLSSPLAWRLIVRESLVLPVSLIHRS